MNYGERIAYWYLRLNGFFLVEDFVLHQSDGLRTSDADLLAVRMRHSNESIAGVFLDLDGWFNDQANLPLAASNVALIVQVKTGGSSDPGSAFSMERLRACVRHMGFCNDQQARDVANELSHRSQVSLGGWRVAKLLITESVPPNTVVLNYELLPMTHALSFIRSRIAAHAHRKANDRMFFSDPLMQFFASASFQEIGRG